jgi:hypothetical protein
MVGKTLDRLTCSSSLVNNGLQMIADPTLNYIGYEYICKVQLIRDGSSVPYHGSVLLYYCRERHPGIGLRVLMTTMLLIH